MINEQIRDKEVRLIGPDGEQLGIMSAKEAYFKAKDANLDLVKIAPTAKPPVCKIIDYGKYRYELARKAKEAKKKQKTVETKEIRLSPNIDTNDLNTKVNQARKFLSKGAKVKVSLRFNSTLQDLDAGRHTEIDMFSGALMRMGRELGIPTPYNEYTYHMIKALEEKNDGLFDYTATDAVTCSR